MGEPFALGRKGLELDAPEVGDIVTVRVRPRPAEEHRPSPIGSGALGLMAGISDRDEAFNAQHYRHSSIWRVLAVNGGQAVVKCLYPEVFATRVNYDTHQREVAPPELWSIAHHQWFEASDLLAALTGATP